MKSGIWTTEFWVTAIMPGLVAILNSVMGWNIDPQVLLGMFGASGAYAVSRGVAKVGKVGKK